VVARTDNDPQGLWSEKRLPNSPRLTFPPSANFWNTTQGRTRISTTDSLKKINELSINGERQLFRAQVVSTRRGMGAHGRRYVLVTVRDDTAYASLFLFASQGYLAQKLKPGDELLITGRVRPGKTSRTVSEISFQQMTEEELAQPKLNPVYALAGELTQGLLRKAVHAALKLAEQGLPESLPESILRHYGLPERLTDAAQYPLSSELAGALSGAQTLYFGGAFPTAMRTALLPPPQQRPQAGHRPRA